MKNLFAVLSCLLGLNMIAFDAHSQVLIQADVVVASSTDFLQVDAAIDLDVDNYAYLSASISVLPTSFLTFSFPQIGHAGDILCFDIQGTGGLLSVSLLNNITVRVYDDHDVNVATATGSSLLDLDLALGASNVYTLRYMTDATASYTIKKVRLEMSNLLSVQLNEFRIYNANLQTPCPPVYATSVNGYTGIVDDRADAVSASVTDYATLKVILAIPPLIPVSASLSLDFTTKGIAGEYVGFTVGEAATLLSVSVLQKIKIDAYDSDGHNVASKNSFALADLRLLTGSTDKYYLGFVTPAGSYTIARLKITLGGISVLNSLKVFNAMHFKLRPAPVSIQSASTNFCSGSTVTLTPVAPGAAAILWSNGSTSNPISVNQAGVYSFKATDNQGCVSTSSIITLASLPLPTVSIGNGATADFCSNANVLLTSTPSSGATVLWSTGATTNNITVNAVATYKVTATGTNGCKSAAASVSVGSLPIPTVTIGNGATTGFCSNADVLLTSTPSSGATVLWSTGATTNNITVNTIGTYKVTATGTNGCKSAAASVSVGSLPIPTVSIGNGAAADFCSNADVLLTSTPSSGATVLWSTGATTNNITVNTIGTYKVTATGTNGCKSAAASVSVGSLPIPTVSIGNGATADFCSNADVLLTSTPSSGATVLWSTGATTNNITVNAAGSYTVTAIGSNGCKASALIDVTTITIPQVSELIKNVTCKGYSNGSIDLAPLDGTSSYTYTWSNSTHATSIHNLTPGPYAVDVKDQSTLCIAHLEYTIVEPQTLLLNGNVYHETCVGGDGRIMLTVNGGTTPYTYNYPAISDNNFSGLTSAVYEITVTDKNTCQATETFAVGKANCSMALNIHNVLTPNNDGLNEVLIIEGIENYPNSNLQVFDKWGDVVYTSDHYDNTWSARNNHNSAPLPSGTYYYILKLNASQVPNGQSDYTGFVLIQ